MQNLILAQAPAAKTSEAQSASPVKKDTGTMEAAEEKSFATQLDKATKDIEKPDNQEKTLDEKNQPSSEETQQTNSVATGTGSSAKTIFQNPIQSQQAGNGTQQIVQPQPIQLATQKTDDALKANTAANQDNLLSRIQKIINSHDIAPEKVTVRMQQQAAQPVPTQTQLNIPFLATTPATAATHQQTNQDTALTSSIDNTQGLAAANHLTDKPLRNESGNQRMVRGQNALSSNISKNGETKAIGLEQALQQGQSETKFQSQPQANQPVPHFTKTADGFASFMQTETAAVIESTVSGASVAKQGSITLPNGTYIYDHQVLHQIQQRFRLNTNRVQHKLKMQLHPAELGELKLDLTVKEGAIRVNVVTQTKQAQEVLERNMPKLRDILEEQGLSVDDISVAQASDTSQDFNFLDEQFGHNTNFSHHEHDNNVKQSFKEHMDGLLHDESVISGLATSPVNNSGISITV